ncbi:hypothetical protein [Acidovorax sp. NCPPB 4044]|uniref:hypothetical protein n=1 Tax=Acidovorax sp. NCPPB 4044 TaxID=2940490 RepID=UPI002302595D|nr:hypothetical protein [Acidovorax sp. NCPPB 4044]MDA8522302.1 hypothetical protein [Acidovorax sp. NCPPB 4044]
MATAIATPAGVKSWQAGVAVGNAAGSLTVAISTVDPAKSSVLICGWTPANGQESSSSTQTYGTFQVSLSASQLTFSGSATGGNVEISWIVIELW